MLIHCDRRATTKTGPFRPKAGTNMGVTCHSCPAGHGLRKRVSGRTRRAKHSSASLNPKPTCNPLGSIPLGAPPRACSRVASRLR